MAGFCCDAEDADESHQGCFVNERLRNVPGLMDLGIAGATIRFRVRMLFVFFFQFSSQVREERNGSIGGRAKEKFDIFFSSNTRFQ